MSRCTMHLNIFKARTAYLLSKIKRLALTPISNSIVIQMMTIEHSGQLIVNGSLMQLQLQDTQNMHFLYKGYLASRLIQSVIEFKWAVRLYTMYNLVRFKDINRRIINCAPGNMLIRPSITFQFVLKTITKCTKVKWYMTSICSSKQV